MLFEQNGERTKVTMRGEADPGVFFKMTEEAFGKHMEMTFESNLQSLKLNMEEI